MGLSVGFHGIWQSSEAECGISKGLTLLAYLFYISSPSVT